MASPRPNCSLGRRSCAGSVRPAPDLCVPRRKSASRIRLSDPWFSDALVTSDVVVTGMHGTGNSFHLVSDVIDRVPKLGYLAAYAKQAMRDKLIEHKQYITRHGDDMPEVKDWRWPAARA